MSGFFGAMAKTNVCPDAQLLQLNPVVLAPYALSGSWSGPIACQALWFCGGGIIVVVLVVLEVLVVLVVDAVEVVDTEVDDVDDVVEEEDVEVLVEDDVVDEMVEEEVDEEGVETNVGWLPDVLI